MIIECPYCESKVDGQVRGEHECFDPEEDPFPFKAILLQCPVCNNALLGGSDLVQVGPDRHEWSALNRLWPKQESSIHWNIPDIVRHSLVEAKQCFKAKAYTASVVMCGRALEGICAHFTSQKSHLAKGLTEMKQNGTIDERLFQWGEELRRQRNIGAHANTTRISREDAQDLLDFVDAICQYVFVLSDRFENFMKRKATNKS